MVTLGAAGLLCILVLVLKWILLGRVRPGRHPLWSCWCSRWDFLYVAWQFHARRVLSTLEGTLFLPWYLRAMGARIGRRVVLGGGFAQVVDPDMLHLEDGATVAGLFQAHSFEDRVLKIDRVRVRPGASAGAGAVLFYGCDVGGRTRVAPQSVVMKGETLLPNQGYAGCPVGIYRFSRRTSSMNMRPSAPGM
jgi:non-ribosomal peptide synthetase-like protein